MARTLITVASCLWFSSLLVAEDRTVTFVFGPTAESTGNVAASAAAASSRQLLNSGANAELRIPGSRDPQVLTKFLPEKDLNAAFAYVAGTARKGAPKDFLKDLDLAAFSLTRHEGKRVLVAVVEGLATDADVESRLGQTTDFCKQNGIRVVVLDASQADPVKALAALATGSEGSAVRDVRTLDTVLGGLLPAEKAVTADAAKAGPVGIPVFTRLFRTVEQTGKASDTNMAPPYGLLITEAPLSAFSFQTDGRNYIGHALVTETVRDGKGAVAWQASKEIVIKGSGSKLDARKTGSVCLLREVKLPGGEYTIESSVEDMDAKKTGNVKAELHPTSTTAGLSLSDAVVVRPLNEAVDKYEADRPLSFDGNALFPLLDPVFPSDTPFDLRVYFVIYPEKGGAMPQMKLEILRDKQVVGTADLKFGDTFGDASKSDAAVEIKHQFPYMARIAGAVLSAGLYEARVTVKQQKQSATRSVAFRVVNGG